MAYIPQHLAVQPHALDFDKVFPEAGGNWAHESVTAALRKQALCITMALMKGKKIAEPLRKTSEFILQKFLPTQEAPKVSVTLTLDEILKLKRKAGLKAEFPFESGVKVLDSNNVIALKK